MDVSTYIEVKQNSNIQNIVIKIKQKQFVVYKYKTARYQIPFES